MKKRKVTRKIQFCMGLAFAVVIASFFFACSNESDALDLQLIEMQYDQKASLTEETVVFKSDMISVLQQVKTRSLDNRTSFSEDDRMHLKESGIKMFLSYGFTEDDLKDAGAKTDEDIIVMATIFAAIMEHPADLPRMMTKSESGGEPCYDGNKIADCILQATGIQTVVTGCLTKVAALGLATKIITKLNPYVGVAALIADFVSCMGWLS